MHNIGLTKNVSMPNLLGMLTQTAIAHFGSKTALARALNISVPAICCWGKLVPIRRAYELRDMTSGALKFDPSAYQKNEKA